MSAIKPPATTSFDDRIRPLIEQFELRRQQIRKKAIYTLSGIAALTLLAALAAASAGAIQGSFFAFVVGAILAGFAYTGLTKSFTKDFKDQVVSAIVKAYHESFRYRSSPGLSETAFKRSQLFKKGIDRYRSEDYVSGTWGQTAFEFSEVHAEYKTTSSNGKTTTTHWHTIFKGIYFIADFHKDFRTQTLVLPDTAEKLFGFLGQKLQSLNTSRGSLVKLEDPEFEREFCVYAADQVEARYILSPALMRRILDLRRKCRDKIYLAFIDSRVFVAISSDHNRFEPSIMEPMDMTTAQGFKRDIDLIVGIIEDLNLNTRIWSKE